MPRLRSRSRGPNAVMGVSSDEAPLGEADFRGAAQRAGDVETMRDSEAASTVPSTFRASCEAGVHPCGAVSAQIQRAEADPIAGITGATAMKRTRQEHPSVKEEEDSSHEPESVHDTPTVERATREGFRSLDSVNPQDVFRVCAKVMSMSLRKLIARV